MPMPKLEFSKISLRYGTADEGVQALDRLDMLVESGQAVSIIGPSGCGKSSMLLLAAGLMRPTSGSMSIDGASLSSPRQGTALILQDFGLLPWKTVYDNAALGLSIRHMPREEIRERTMHALEDVGLAEFAESYPSALSGGMKQRLALARAVALDMDLLLMDEPLSALDALLRESLQDALLEQWRTRHQTQVLVTHSIDEAVYLGQRIMVMSGRPGHLLGIVDNPGMGEALYRATDEFATRCEEVRELLKAGDAA